MKKNMNKSTVVHKNSSYHRAADVPEVIDMDSLSYYDDDGLERRHNQLQSEREKALSGGHEPTPWEIEICYVQREMKIRTSRRAAHEKYLRTNPDVYQDGYAQFD